MRDYAFREAPPEQVPRSRCVGTLPRRGFLRMGFSAFGGLTLGDLLLLQSRAAADRSSHVGPWARASGPRQPRLDAGTNQKALIVIWLWGGASHMETFDLKPEAPREFRGEFRPIATAAPGIAICEHLPQLARLGDKFTLIRSLNHDSPGHINSTHTVLTGYPGEVPERAPWKPRYPDFWSIVAKVRGERVSGMPAHVALPTLRYNGSAYLHGTSDPFVVESDPNQRGFHVPDLALERLTQARFSDRRDLLRQFDRFRRAIDARAAESIDGFNQQAADILTRGVVKRAFEIEQEPPALRDRYGRHEVGQRCLLARRLIEAGVRMVTVDFPCVPGQKAFSWDDHSANWHIFNEMKTRLPVLDQVTSALVDDLYARGLDKDVLVVVMGEMSHTPRLTDFHGRPGREHWARTMSAFVAGGGLRMGQAIGATNGKGDEVLARPVKATDLLATLYAYLGIPLETSFIDGAGRPIRILPDGAMISELLG